MRSLVPSMRKPGSLVAALCVAALAVACQEQPTTDPFEGFVCTASVEPAIVVRLVDGETGMEGLPGFALMTRPLGTVRDGGYVDSLRVASFSEDTLQSVWAAPERPGRYDVLVRIDGYGDWLALGVTVEGGVCHVQTVELRAVLLPD